MKFLGLFAKKTSYSLEKHSRDIPQILAVYGASICTFMFGVTLTWPSPTIPKLLKPEYGITIEEASYLAVIDPIAMIVASPFCSRLADKIGRKSTMFFVPIMVIISYLLTAFTKSIYILYFSRVFAGLSYAGTYSTVPIYVGEVTTPKVRSKHSHSLMTMAFSGQFLISLVGFYCDIPTTAYILLIIPVVALIILYFLPESPYYYIMKSDSEKARRSLEVLRGTKNVDDELVSITAAVERQLAEPGHFKDLFIVPSNRRALIVCNMARAIQQFCGITTFTTFTQYIFEQAGTDISSGIGAMIFNAMLIISNLFLSKIYAKVGIRLAMVYSCAGVFVALLGETIFFFLKQYTAVDVSVVNWFPVLGLVMFVVFYCIGQSNVPTLVLGEVFSSKIKPHGIMFMNVTFALYIATANKLFQVFMSTFGLFLPFFMFTIVAFVSIFTSYYVIPETKGKTLEQIQMMLKT